MLKAEVQLSLRIRFFNEYNIGGGKGSGNIHGYLLKDIQGRPYVPASQLKGCISHSAKALEKYFPQADYEYLFGKEGNNRGALYFDDAVLQPNMDTDIKHLVMLRTNVAISRYTRTGVEGHLRTIESSGRAGTMEFHGMVQGFLRDYRANTAFLYCASRMIYALGSNKSRGLGWLAEPIQADLMIDGQNISPEQMREWAVSLQ